MEAAEDAVLRRADALLYGIISPSCVEMEGAVDVCLKAQSDVDSTRSAACNPNRAAGKDELLERDEEGKKLERKRYDCDKVEKMGMDSMKSKGDVDSGDVNLDLEDDVSLGKLLVAVDAAALRLFGKSIRGWKLHLRDRRDARRAMHIFVGACASTAASTARRNSTGAP